jgi:hypothetical protein
MTLVSPLDENEAQFKTRLIGFWTKMLRSFPEEYEGVYAETAQFETAEGRLCRGYLVDVSIADLMERETRSAGLECKPIDRDDLYSKYEAAPPEWFQIPH